MDGHDAAVDALGQQVVGAGLFEQQVDDRLRRVEDGVVKQIGADERLEPGVNLWEEEK